MEPWIMASGFNNSQSHTIEARCDSFTEISWLFTPEVFHDYESGGI